VQTKRFVMMRHAGKVKICLSVHALVRWRWHFSISY